jgi:hypothetical protein
LGTRPLTREQARILVRWRSGLHFRADWRGGPGMSSENCPACGAVESLLCVSAHDNPADWCCHCGSLIDAHSGDVQPDDISTPTVLDEARTGKLTSRWEKMP